MTIWVTKVLHLGNHSYHEIAIWVGFALSFPCLKGRFSSSNQMSRFKQSDVEIQAREWHDSNKRNVPPYNILNFRK